mmetsp:Transcript_742/g.1698  ORF Transcript_742/g.1698 Transcript_742/m.1698 type:complete len:202 (-) Transcript_742:846-1451(-)
MSLYCFCSLFDSLANSRSSFHSLRFESFHNSRLTMAFFSSSLENSHITYPTARSVRTSCSSSFNSSFCIRRIQYLICQAAPVAKCKGQMSIFKIARSFHVGLWKPAPKSVISYASFSIIGRKVSFSFSFFSLPLTFDPFFPPFLVTGAFDSAPSLPFRSSARIFRASSRISFDSGDPPCDGDQSSMAALARRSHTFFQRLY